MAEPGYNLLATPLVVRFSQTPQTTDRKIIVFYTFFFEKWDYRRGYELKCSESGLIEEREYSEVFHVFRWSDWRMTQNGMLKK